MLVNYTCFKIANSYEILLFLIQFNIEFALQYISENSLLPNKFYKFELTNEFRMCI